MGNGCETGQENARMVLFQDRKRLKEELRTIGAMNRWENGSVLGVKESRPMMSPISAAESSVP